MNIKIIITLITVCFLKNSPCLASAEYQHHEVTSEKALILLGTFLKKHHDQIKKSVIASAPFGEDINYAQLSSGQREQLDNFISSQLIVEAQRALPLSMGEIIAAFMHVHLMEDLDENPYQEAYHDHGISDLQIKEASQLIHDNFHRLRTNIQENADVSRIAKKHQVDFLIQALGEEIIDLLQENMKIDISAALEIYAYLQRLERILVLQKKEEREWNLSGGVAASSSSSTEKEQTNLVLASSFSSSDVRPSHLDDRPSHLEKHWQTYALITGGLGIAALIALLKPDVD